MPPAPQDGACGSWILWADMHSASLGLRQGTVAETKEHSAVVLGKHTELFFSTFSQVEVSPTSGEFTIYLVSGWQWDPD